MGRTSHGIIGFGLLVLTLTLASEPGRAHKPITSPFTYNEDVFPILRDRCAGCHVPNGVAPMSLMTYEDTVPWGESIRVELLAGHMPPWSVDSASTRFHNAQSLSPREMNILLTWATGGTPLGDPAKTPQPVTTERRWPLGTPDLELPLPNEFVLPAGKQEEVAEFTIPTGLTDRRWLRAVDIVPGTPSVVRSATVHLKATSPEAAQGMGTEPVLALWLPGDEPIPPSGNAAFEVPARAELLVRIRYRKTWQYERQEIRDRSTVGLYFSGGVPASEPVRALALTDEGPGLQVNASRRYFSQPLTSDARALAIYPNEHPANAGIVVAAVGPDGARRELIAFHPQRDWTRRYWFREPISLARGTRLETTVTIDDETPALPVGAGREPQAQDRSRVRLTLNVTSMR
jgi:hypothetical protein